MGREERRALRRLERDLARAADAGVARREGEFWWRVLRGDYGGLLDQALQRVMAQAAAERGIAIEIGAVRVVLARVLAEVEDPSEQALAVSRLARAAVIAAEEHRRIAEGLGGEMAEGLREALERIEAAVAEDEERAREALSSRSDAAMPEDESFGSESEQSSW